MKNINLALFLYNLKTSFTIKTLIIKLSLTIWDLKIVIIKWKIVASLTFKTVILLLDYAEFYDFEAFIWIKYVLLLTPGTLRGRVEAVIGQAVEVFNRGIRITLYTLLLILSCSNTIIIRLDKKTKLILEIIYIDAFLTLTLLLMKTSFKELIT